MRIYKEIEGKRIVKVTRTLDLIMISFEDDQGKKFTCTSNVSLECFGTINLFYHLGIYIGPIQKKAK